MEAQMFLAVTEWEMEDFLPPALAYMACRFSPYSSGLTNLPSYLPPGSILLLEDSMPIAGHDPQIVKDQLDEIIRRFSLRALLLDFQNPVTDEGKHMTEALLQALPCPVAVTESYASIYDDCAVFLSPPAVNKALLDHLQPWRKRDIFLEVTGDRQQFTVTRQGCSAAPLPPGTTYNTPHHDPKLHCHYHIEVSPEKAIFTLQRTKEDLQDLAEEALRLGVRSTVGLYQELK